eukprot:TRINITY_DN91743_c0_g1_i1.p1 TRINITY_DN91743_c0_g1~~TRINITY_DN91743_c0_g1_i1.p1  ORF type:complete len:1722 (+),score=453.10 TRINITY_DN91743_c0_g1_i1:64-5229(+)
MADRPCARREAPDVCHAEVLLPPSLGGVLKKPIPPATPLAAARQCYEASPRVDERAAGTSASSPAGVRPAQGAVAAPTLGQTPVRLLEDFQHALCDLRADMDKQRDALEKQPQQGALDELASSLELQTLQLRDEVEANLFNYEADVEALAKRVDRLEASSLDEECAELRKELARLAGQRQAPVQDEPPPTGVSTLDTDRLSSRLEAVDAGLDSVETAATKLEETVVQLSKSMQLLEVRQELVVSSGDALRVSACQANDLRELAQRIGRVEDDVHADQDSRKEARRLEEEGRHAAREASEAAAASVQSQFATLAERTACLEESMRSEHRGDETESSAAEIRALKQRLECSEAAAAGLRTDLASLGRRAESVELQCAQANSALLDRLTELERKVSEDDRAESPADGAVRELRQRLEDGLEAANADLRTDLVSLGRRTEAVEMQLSGSNSALLDRLTELEHGVSARQSVDAKETTAAPSLESAAVLQRLEAAVEKLQADSIWQGRTVLEAQSQAAEGLAASGDMLHRALQDLEGMMGRGLIQAQTRQSELLASFQDDFLVRSQHQLEALRAEVDRRVREAEQHLQEQWQDLMGWRSGQQERPQQQQSAFFPRFAPLESVAESPAEDSPGQSTHSISSLLQENGSVSRMGPPPWAEFVDLRDKVDGLLVGCPSKEAMAALLAGAQGELLTALQEGLGAAQEQQNIAVGCLRQEILLLQHRQGALRSMSDIAPAADVATRNAKAAEAEQAALAGQLDATSETVRGLSSSVEQLFAELESTRCRLEQHVGDSRKQDKTVEFLQKSYEELRSVLEASDEVSRSIAEELRQSLQRQQQSAAPRKNETTDEAIQKLSADVLTLRTRLDESSSKSEFRPGATMENLAEPEQKLSGDIPQPGQKVRGQKACAGTRDEHGTAIEQKLDALSRTADEWHARIRQLEASSRANQEVEKAPANEKVEAMLKSGLCKISDECQRLDAKLQALGSQCDGLGNELGHLQGHGLDGLEARVNLHLELLEDRQKKLELQVERLPDEAGKASEQRAQSLFGSLHDACHRLENQIEYMDGRLKACLKDQVRTDDVTALRSLLNEGLAEVRFKHAEAAEKIRAEVFSEHTSTAVQALSDAGKLQEVVADIQCLKSTVRGLEETFKTLGGAPAAAADSAAAGSCDVTVICAKLEQGLSVLAEQLQQHMDNIASKADLSAFAELQRIVEAIQEGQQVIGQQQQTQQQQQLQQQQLMLQRQEQERQTMQLQVDALSKQTQLKLNEQVQSLLCLEQQVEQLQLEGQTVLQKHTQSQAVAAEAATVLRAELHMEWRTLAERFDKVEQLVQRTVMQEPSDRQQQQPGVWTPHLQGMTAELDALRGLRGSLEQSEQMRDDLLVRLQKDHAASLADVWCLKEKFVILSRAVDRLVQRELSEVSTAGTTTTPCDLEKLRSELTTVLNGEVLGLSAELEMLRSEVKSTDKAWQVSAAGRVGIGDVTIPTLEGAIAEMRRREEEFREVVSHLTTGVIKMAQLLGVATEDAFEKLGWRDMCMDLPRMMDHAWLRSRLPKRTSMLKVLRQKADAEQVRELQNQIEALGQAMTHYVPVMQGFVAPWPVLPVPPRESSGRLRATSADHGAVPHAERPRSGASSRSGTKEISEATGTASARAASGSVAAGQRQMSPAVNRPGLVLRRPAASRPCEDSPSARQPYCRPAASIVRDLARRRDTQEAWVAKEQESAAAAELAA